MAYDSPATGDAVLLEEPAETGEEVEIQGTIAILHGEGRGDHARVQDPSTVQSAIGEQRPHQPGELGHRGFESMGGDIAEREWIDGGALAVTARRLGARAGPVAT